MNKTLEGAMTETWSWPKASLAICFSSESGSNKIDESDWQPEKHDEPRTSTFRGIMIDSIDESRNASDSIRINRELDSNEIDESE
jgi:hypothetical protein